MRTAIIIALHALILVPSVAFVVAGAWELWHHWDEWA